MGISLNRAVTALSRSAMCAETVPKCLSEIQPKTLTFVNNLSISEQKKGTRLDAVSLGDEVSSSSFRSSPPGAGHRRGPRMMRFNRFRDLNSPASVRSETWC